MTVPKIKDLVNAPSKQYQAMYSLISSGSSSPDIIESDLIPKVEKKNDMKNELTSFFKRKVSDNLGTTYISNL